MGLDEDFNLAANKARAFTKKPSESDMLEIYSLYKQASIGDINIAKPSGSEAAMKYDAWSKKKGLSTTQAKEQYIAKVKALSPKYA